MLKDIDGSDFFTVGILADESKCGEQKIFVICLMYWDSKINKPVTQLLDVKDLSSCTGKSIAQAVYNTCHENHVNLHQCYTFLSDNTNYMSGQTGGAVAIFNTLANINCFRIPYGMHVAPLIMNL